MFAWELIKKIIYAFLSEGLNPKRIQEFNSGSLFQIKNAELKAKQESEHEKQSSK